MSIVTETGTQAFVTLGTNFNLVEKRARFNFRTTSPLSSSSTERVEETTSVWIPLWRSARHSLRHQPLLLTARPAPMTATMRLSFLTPPPLNEVSSASSQSSEGSKLVPAKDENGELEVGAVEISGKLKGAIQRLYAAHVSESGVDYESMGRSPEFREYQAAVARLPSLDIKKELVTDEQKVSFYVNLYNAMTQHAIVCRGAPPSFSAARLLWGMRMTYEIGEYRLSIHEIENGILRQNKGISIIPPPFGWFDGRKSLCVDHVDPRIHFVLNCAATSCPPVLFLTVENLERTLQRATEGFISNKDNFRMDDDGRVYLSMIFKWYKDDFAPGGSDKMVLSFVAKNAPARNEFVPRLVQMLGESGASQVSPIEWLPYDWSLNAV